jgi:hypothetical protein
MRWMRSVLVCLSYFFSGKFFFFVRPVLFFFTDGEIGGDGISTVTGNIIGIYRDYRTQTDIRSDQIRQISDRQIGSE